MSTGSRFIFWLPRIFEEFEAAVKPAQRYREFMELSEGDKEIFKHLEKKIKENYKLYVLPLKDRLKDLELYTEERGEKIERILSIKDGFFALPDGMHRKGAIITVLGLRQEFKFLNNNKNFCAASGPYIACKDCQKRGSLCEYHFDYGRKTGWKHIASGDINPNKKTRPKKIICENCNVEKPYYTLNICEECFDDEVDKYYSDDGYDGE